MMVPMSGSAANRENDQGAAGKVGKIHPPTEISPILYRPVKKNVADLNPGTRTIRVLVQYSKSGFFVANGRPYGLEYEAFAEYEKYLNSKRSKKAPKIIITFIPVCFEDLIPYLLEGKGDVAAGQITVTNERQKHVAFTTPYIRNVREVLVSNSGAPALQNIEDISGKTVHVVRGSSFVQRLDELNDQFTKKGLPQVNIVKMPSIISSSDILEMVNAGILKHTFVDNFVADLWLQVLPDIKISNDIRLNEAGDIAWAVRPDNPNLLESLNQFIYHARHNLKEKTNRIWKDYFKNTKFIKNPLEMEAYALVRTLSPHFKEAGVINKLDWLMMMAQGYQESEL